MKIQNYIKKNWGKLPKSSFNDDEVVIIKCIKNDDQGYGHHSYEGVGVDKEGGFVWCFSSGCSCNGSCSVEHNCEKDVKSFQVDGAAFDLEKIDYKTLDFSSLQVDFKDY